MFYDAFERFRLTGRDLVYLLACLRNAGRSYDDAPIILCNSYPKSGTHLLSQIIQKFENVRYWNDILSVQSLSGVMNSKNHIRWKFASAPPGALVRSHLMHTPEICEILASRPTIRLFIYRDPRDVVVSHANWVLKEPRIFLHDIYKQMANFDDCLMASIRGLPLGSILGSNVSQPDISTDFARWQGWLNDPNVLALKFEDLVGERGGGGEHTRIERIDEIAKMLGRPLPLQQLKVKFGSFSLDPNKSHTFKKGNKGVIGSWRDRFTDAHKSVFKEVAGTLLIDLGYEINHDW